MQDPDSFITISLDGALFTFKDRKWTPEDPRNIEAVDHLAFFTPPAFRHSTAGEVVAGAIKNLEEQGFECKIVKEHHAPFPLYGPGYSHKTGFLE